MVENYRKTYTVTAILSALNVSCSSYYRWLSDGVTSVLTEVEEGIRYTGGILVDNGYVDAGYIDKMLEREGMASTFMGNSLAIPHGTEDAKANVLETGISVVTVPEGVDFGNGNIAKILIGIAGKNNEHLEILSNIAIVCSEEENIEKILNATSEDEILELFSEVS